MAVEIIDPRYGNSKKTLHDLIILILAKEYPLKINEIAVRLKKEFKADITFQAVRKALNVMVDRKILDVKEKEYSVNKSEILELKKLTDNLMKTYYAGEKTGKSLPTKKDESISEYRFDNLISADQFWSEVVLEWANGLKEHDEKIFCFHGPHCWYIFGHLGLESAFCQELQKNHVAHYNLIEENTLIDRWAADFYRSYRAYYTINKQPTGMKTALAVFGDYLIQYDYPEELYKKIHDFYVKSKNLKTMKINDIAQALKMKTELTLTIMKNKTIAQKIKEEIIRKVLKE